MITLDATLKTAQDGINHRPIVEIISSPAKAVIPLQGNYFNNLDDPESDPNIIETSAGRLILVAIRNGDLQYYYTDINRVSWNLIADLYTGYIANDVSVCELTNGNIGIIMVVQTGATFGIKYMIISPTGGIVTSATDIIAFQSNWLSAAYVITLANDTYLLVYAEGTGSPPSESNSYYIKKQTSSNFTSWGSASAITLTGLATARYKNNPHLLQLSGGRIFLHFDYLNQLTNNIEINNPHYCYSDNNGSTWNAPVKITDYDELGTTGLHPVVSEKDSGGLTFVYNEEANVKIIDDEMPGYPGSEIYPLTIDFNQSDKKLYIFDNHAEQIIDFDAGIWEYERVYNPATSPAHPSIQQSYRGSGKFSVTGTSHIATVINHNTETLTRYLANTASGGVDPNFQTSAGTNLPKCVFIRQTETENQLWILYLWGDFTPYIEYGYIDLDEVKDPITGMYTWNSLFVGETANHWSTFFDLFRMQYIEEHNWIMFIGHDNTYINTRGIVITKLDGTVIKHYCTNTLAQFPYHGAHDAVYYNNYVYFTFYYSSAQPDKRGLARINLNNDNIVFFVPTWTTANNYELFGLIRMEGTTKLLMTCAILGSGGVATFDMSTSTWVIYNNETLPGIIPPGASDDNWGGTFQGYTVLYDPETETIYASNYGGHYIVAFSEYGSFSILKYADVSDPDTTPIYGEIANLSYDNFEDQAVIIYDNDDVLWVIWRHMDDDKYSLQWSNAIADKNLSDYLSLEAVIKIVWDIDRPAKLTFGLSHGHIFDPQNLLSTYSVFLKKGRELTIRFGEIISDTEYWQNQGTFVVTEQSLSYTTDKYPEMKITAEDMQCMWEDNHIIATQYYNQETPKQIIENILSEHADLEASEMDIPIFTGSHDLYHQYVDMNIEDMIKSLLDHFMYFPFVNVDGKFEPLHLNINKSVDHVYSNVTQITQYTPDSKYSTFINRIVVAGLSHIYYEVLYEEEVIERISGTTGWWGKKEDDKVWYSNNHTKTCRNPRLEIIQSVNEFGMFSAFGGGKESITEVDPDEQYCIITTTAPNMIPILTALIGVAVATYTACRGSCDGGPHKQGWCSFCNFAVIMELNALILILTGIASYNYNLWARPIGHEQRTHEAEANDYDFQAELNGKKITETIEDPYCYTINQCKTVADQEIAAISAQRRRHKFTKTAHLQDEIGDIIDIPHPYSGETLTTMIVKLTREMKIGEHFLDHIEGWRLIS